MKKGSQVCFLLVLWLLISNGCVTRNSKLKSGYTNTQTEVVSTSVCSSTTNRNETQSNTTAAAYSSKVSVTSSTAKTSITKERIKEGKTMLYVSESKNLHNLNGFSSEWDPHIFRRWNTDSITTINPMFDPEKDWKLFKNRIKAMGIHRARVWIQPEWFSSSSGTYDFSDNNEAVYAVTKQLDLAQEMGMKINLTIWCADRSGWLGYSNAKDWCSAPNNKDIYADITSHVLQEFLVKRGYSCIHELTLFNEPSWAYYCKNGQVDFTDYATMVRVVNQKLIDIGLRDKIQLVVSDDAEHTGWYQQSVSELFDIADIYASHTYAYSLETTNKTISDWVRGRTDYSKEHGGDKPFLVDEFGTNHVIPPMKATDVYTYERGLFLSKFVIDALNQGAAGVSYWCMYNQNYGPGNMMEVGLWGFADEKYAVRPTYHAWGMINHYTAVNSEIYAMSSDDSEEIIGVALKAPNERWSYIVANLSDEERSYTIVSPHKQQKSYKKTTYTKKAVTLSDKIIQPTKYTDLNGNTLKGSLPANSFAIYSGNT